MEEEIKVNARGLTSPGPRLMVENALARKSCRLLRVVVSSPEAVEDIRAHFSRQNLKISVDQIGEDYHVFLQFDS
jgi:TusA-related sulfurtransferase